MARASKGSKEGALRLALILVFAAWPQGAGAQESVEAGAVAAPGRWPIEGGSAARSAVSLAPALGTEPIEAWTVRPGGAIEGEPLVFDGVVLTSSRSGAGRRTLTEYELETGRVLLHQVLPASIPLRPVLYRDRILVRPEPNRIDVYRARAGRLLSLRTIRARESISPPLVFADHLLVRVDDELRSYALGVAEPTWRTRVEGAFRGSPSALGNGVFASFEDPEGVLHIGSFDRVDGHPLREVPIAGGRPPAPGFEPDRPVLLDDGIVVTGPTPFSAVSGSGRSHALVARIGSMFGTTPARLMDFSSPPVAIGVGWIARLDGERPSWVSARDGEDGLRVLPLADDANHPELLAGTAGATRTGNVVYFGGLAFDVLSGNVLWKRAPWLARAVPADGFLLVVESPDALTALRAKAPPQSEAEISAITLAKELQAKAAEGLALHAGRSARLGDRELATHWIDEAIQLGARGRAVDSARDAVERIPAGSPRRQVDPIRLRAAEKEAERLRRLPTEGLLAAALDTGDPAQRRALLFPVLRDRPEDPRAWTAVLAMLPKDAPEKVNGASAMSWLEFLDASAHAPVRFLVPGREGDAGPQLNRVLAARDGWRPDLVGVLSARLLIVSGPDHPGAVARCLEIGELVCDLLEDFFDAKTPAGAPPLTLYLYDSRSSYLDQSRRSGESGESFLGWTVGHYSPAEDVSRMYVPSDDATIAPLLGTYAHELTHHWLQDRAPFQHAAPQPGLPFWIVEGFARMVEEFRLDPASGTFDPVNPRASSLDLVASSGAGDLIPWPRLVGLDQPSFRHLTSEPRASIPLHWTLGVRAQPSEIQLFYAQAAGLCHALNATPGGKQRLRGALEAWYGAKSGGLAPTAAFPVAPGELGSYVFEAARRVASGD